MKIHFPKNTENEKHYARFIKENYSIGDLELEPDNGVWEVYGIDNFDEAYEEYRDFFTVGTFPVDEHEYIFVNRSDIKNIVKDTKVARKLNSNYTVHGDYLLIMKVDNDNE